MTDTTLHNYDYGVSTESDTAASHVVALVGDARRVLEIGAGPGSITRELCRWPQRKLSAVEVDPAAIEKLKALTPRVYSADLNEAGWQRALCDDGPFDAIVSADVLEHLYDPWAVLASLRHLLTPNGHVVVSLPHVSHFGVVACILDEDFEYRDLGLLDRTHIRFFGLKNMQALFDQTGFRIVDAHAVLRPADRSEFGRRWARLPLETRRVLEQVNPFGVVYQVIVKAALADGTPSVSLMQRIGERISQHSGQALPWHRAAREWLRGHARARLSDGALHRLRALAFKVGIRL